MTQSMKGKSDQRRVIGRMPTGQPRTYRLARPRSRGIFFLAILRRLHP